MGSLRFVPMYVLPCLLVLNFGVFGYPDLRIEDGPGCWKEACTRRSLRSEKILDGKSVPNDNDQIQSIGDCQNLCKAYEDPDGGGKTCNYFHYEDLTKFDVCYLLEEVCEAFSRDDNKYSGPKDCDDQPFCVPLTYPTDDDAETIYWTCNDGEIDPYKDEIPVGAKCYTRCKKDDKGEEIEYDATCEKDDADPKKGKWTLSDDAFDPTKQETKCECPKFNLWYDPNVEDGAIFSCTKPVADEEIEKDNRCALICGYEVVRDIFCHNGQWNDADEDEYKEGGTGIGCYNRPPTTTTTTKKPDE